jgi:hypothetical protein
MASHSPHFGLPLPGIRDLFPGMCSSAARSPSMNIRPRPFPSTAHSRSPGTFPVGDPRPATAHSQWRMSRPFSFVICPSSNHFQVELSPAITSFHPQPPSTYRSTARDRTIDPVDRPYMRAHFRDPVLPYPHVPQSIHITRWGPGHSVDRRFIPRELTPDSRSRHKIEHGIGPSGPPGKERTGFPVPLSPRMVSDTTGSLEGKSIGTRSRKKGHKCEVCGSHWKRPSFLKIHMVSHTRVKGT